MGGTVFVGTRGQTGLSASRSARTIWQHAWSAQVWSKVKILRLIFFCNLIIFQTLRWTGPVCSRVKHWEPWRRFADQKLPEERTECVRTCKSLGLALAVLLNGVCHCEDQERLYQAACYGECLNPYQICLIPTKEEDPKDGAIGLWNTFVCK